MNKKSIAIIIELIPILSAIISTICIKLTYQSEIIQYISMITVVLSLLGFIFAIIGKKIYGYSNTVKVLGILDVFSTIYIILFYTIVVFIFGL